MNVDRTITTLAVLKVNWDHLKKDYIENFVPLVVRLINKKQIEVIDDINKISEEFAAEWGLIIPYYPMVSIINRVKKKGFIKQINGKLYPIKEKIIKADFGDLSEEQVRQQEKVINEFIDYSEKMYDIKLDRNDAERALISFLREHDSDILFTAQRGTVLPNVKITRTHKFLLCNFINHAAASEPDIFDFITNITVGHILASTLLYAEFDKFSGKLKKINLYFDTAFVFRLLGVDGGARRDVYLDFVKLVRNEGTKLFVFDHTYEEIQQILDNTLMWIGNPNYDPNKASQVLNHFIQQNFTQSDVERIIVGLKSNLENLGITIMPVVDPNKDKLYQIDDEKLHSLIVETYKEQSATFAEWEKESTVRKDIRSITAVYKLRQGRKPRHINEAGHIFVTTNKTLAFIATKYELSEGKNGFIIPVCVTDVFLGTLIWLQSPPAMLEINQKKIIADCYAAVQPDAALIRKYSLEIEKLKKQNIISVEECYLLRSSRVARDLLEEKTLGDPDNFTDKTPEEILEDIKNKFKKDGEKQYIQEKEYHERTAKQLLITKLEKERTHRSIERLAGFVSKCCSFLIFLILIPLISIGTIFTFQPDLFTNHPWVKTIILVVFAIANLFNIVYGYYIKDVGNKIEALIKNKIIKCFESN